MMFSYAELADCARRELSMRKWVYPNRVGARKMKQATADREMAMMQAIAEHFEKMAAEKEQSL
jgi:hypothetical protein